MSLAPPNYAELDILCDHTPNQLDKIRSEPSDFDSNGHSVELDHIDRLQIEQRRALNLPRDPQLEDSNQARQRLAHNECQRIRADAVRLSSSIRSGPSSLSPPPPSRGKPARGGKSHCVFCKKNNEMPCLYNNHVLKDDEGVVLCPILRKYICRICGATGRSAHTVKYCPLNDGEYATAPNLPFTSHLSTGKKRR